MIFIRQTSGIKLGIWQIMLISALIVLLTSQISPYDGQRSINCDVIVFLASMFITGEAMQRSGILLFLSCQIQSNVKGLDQLVLLILFGMRMLSASMFVLMASVWRSGVIQSLIEGSNANLARCR